LKFDDIYSKIILQSNSKVEAKEEDAEGEGCDDGKFNTEENHENPEVSVYPIFNKMKYTTRAIMGKQINREPECEKINFDIQYSIHFEIHFETFIAKLCYRVFLNFFSVATMEYSTPRRITRIGSLNVKR
jgi:hypothetical protein